MAWSDLETKTKDPRRQIIGRRSKAAGEHFELFLNRSCDYYKGLGIAIIDKTPEPFHITKNLGNGKMQGYFETQAQPDYKGILCDGSSIMFEAKHTDSDRILQNVVSDKQVEMLNDYTALGAQCFVMVSMGYENYYRVPWFTWKNMKEFYGHKYMDAKELEEFRLKIKECTLLILEGVEVNDN